MPVFGRTVELHIRHEGKTKPLALFCLRLLGVQRQAAATDGADNQSGAKRL